MASPFGKHSTVPSGARSLRRDSKLNLASKGTFKSKRNSAHKVVVQTLDKGQTAEAQLEATYCAFTNTTQLEKGERRKNNVKLDKRFSRAASGPGAREPAAGAPAKQATTTLQSSV